MTYVEVNSNIPENIPGENGIIQQIRSFPETPGNPGSILFLIGIPRTGLRRVNFMLNTIQACCNHSGISGIRIHIGPRESVLKA
jgi:hypothetical protein